jgi:hypothetical protein
MRLNTSMIIVLILVTISSIACSKDAPTEQVVKVSGKVNTWEQKFEGFETLLRISPDFTQLQTGFDFNGDGVSDYLYFTEVINTELAIPDSVVVFQVQSEEAHPSTLSGALHAIAIVHGGTDDHIVIHEAKSMTMLDAPAAIDALVEKHGYIASIEDVGPLKDAKGDIIILPTGAGIDTYIYYDGQRYHLYEPLEIP